ncbi:hypothetical protein GC584_05950 [Corynebacterium sp. zg912]|uniref:Integral membrane protein n=1 Tax=Corynebacterium wankanglinii TaxID=2735136 RepID=A0A7H0KC98_9CORY|nr:MULTISPECIES: hypothetical protein [Corynebacterium]MBA1836024.1 hypothetical protein [Corynebacterium wankanglinii]MBA1837583.1 hypothetical protein [Corynebacterium wankanglinii]MCR5928961.1 hypothetical protein [Corynebacterium sp. zg912]QNP94914.1 hypothetical protein IA203_05415 [Corynebacterium wankanglinii]
MSDHRRPLVRALKVAGWALVALTVVSLMAWGAAREIPGIWAVLMGVAVGGSFVLLTAVSVLVTSNSSPSATMAVVLGGWLLKMGVLVLFLLWIRGFNFYDHKAFGVTTIAALVVALAAETWGVITTRTTYLD